MSARRMALAKDVAPQVFILTAFSEFSCLIKSVVHKIFSCQARIVQDDGATGRTAKKHFLTNNRMATRINIKNTAAKPQRC
jgi:hypothetical protein